ncbi:hypothetical protein Cgig2_007316 [Carnegiea gigantea]|uniref:Protein kinase domain-containing protein n=1 Tax=Carnegiea gigantea TaxID=171969 RepID=A0A9Q1KZN3_9CARY|nr:hypothetical protein Cgig2_007316 [Carnegiea gigantea]
MMIAKIGIFLLSIANFATSTPCNLTCGGERVNYPFGFSEGCQFRLICTPEGKMEFKGFGIRNITSESLLLNMSANCSRPIGDIHQLFGETYALASQNVLLLRNCSSPLNGCAVPWSLLENRFGPQAGCGGGGGVVGRGENMSCYASEVQGRVLSFKDVRDTGCKVLYSSMGVDDSSDSTAHDGSDVMLAIQTVQVSWWLSGSCGGCDGNASCVKVPPAGYRCRCNAGFSGDGFAAGHVQGLRRYRGRKIAVIGGIIGCAATILFLALLCYFCRRRSTCSQSQTRARRLLSEAAGNATVPLYPYKEIEKATSGFCEKQRIGTGAYGTVYAGRLHSSEYVAIKKIKHRDTDSIEQVMNEIKLISSVSHPNLVRLLGCCIENGEQILVYEYMPNGTLSQHLQREKGTGLPWTVRLNIATETAQAIAYLHSAMNPPIYHRDIKSSNILLDFDYRSKVADFGLSRLGMMESSHISTAPQGTPGYVDPQYHQNFHLSDKSDVYSFGVVLVEIITAMKVVDFNRPHTEVNLAALAVDRIGRGCVDEIVDPFIELHRDAWTLSSVHKVAELAFRCLAYHKDMRPSMMEVAYELEQIRMTGWAPLEENICMESSIASSCSSPFNRSERSLTGISVKKGGNRRIMVPQKTVDHLASLQEAKDSSPVSVHDPWFSEHSSPSSLLGNSHYTGGYALYFVE